MSALGNILQQVEFKVKELLARVTEHETEQDKRLDDLTARMELLEGRPAGTASRKAPPAKTARAGAAEAKGVSQP